jgi:hypothetical protein
MTSFDTTEADVYGFVESAAHLAARGGSTWTV